MKITAKTVNTITVKTQAEWDALPAEFDEQTVVEIRDTSAPIEIRRVPDNARAVLSGNASAVLSGNTRAVLSGNASAVLWENASAVLRGNASAVLGGGASAVLWGNASAVLRGSASAVLGGGARAVLWDNARAELSGNASAVLWGYSSAHAYGNSSLRLRMRSCAWVFSPDVSVDAATTATVIRPPLAVTTQDWLEQVAITPDSDGFVTLFKRVSKDFRTQEGTENETSWALGRTNEASNWEPHGDECGKGKFHACPAPYLCDDFRNKEDDRYVAVRISVADLHAWPTPQYPTKIAFRKGTVLHEVDREGNRINYS